MQFMSRRVFYPYKSDESISNIVLVVTRFSSDVDFSDGIHIFDHIKEMKTANLVLLSLFMTSN